MLGELPVSSVIALVKEEPEEVKAGEEGSREVDVLARGAPLVIPWRGESVRVRECESVSVRV